MQDGLDIESLKGRIGEELFVSEWITVGQEEINAFARVTRDPDPMHIDPAYAKEHGPFGTTVLFGFQILSMLSHFQTPLRGHGSRTGRGYELNYGLNRVRFVQPIRVDIPFRNRVRLKDVRQRADGAFLITTTNTIEVQGSDRPALVAEWIGFIATDRPTAG
jgi:acyl dehydratase